MFTDFQLWFKKDARHFQILCLSLFLLYGIVILGWDADIYQYLTLVGVCLGVQYLGMIAGKAHKDSWKSALISALGLCLLFKSDTFWVWVLGAALTIGSKFILRLNGKHFFNPTNFGIIVAILLTGKAYISPGQWGNAAIFWGFIGLLGMNVLFKVGRIETSLSFLITLLLLEAGRNLLYLGWPVDYFFHQFTSGTILLFTFFMITDPVSTPNHKWGRVIWASLTAILTFILSSRFFVNGAPVWALFYLSFLTPLVDYFLKGNLFLWTSNEKPSGK